MKSGLKVEWDGYGLDWNHPRRASIISNRLIVGRTWYMSRLDRARARCRGVCMMGGRVGSRIDYFGI